MIKKVAIEELMPIIIEALNNNKTITFTPSGNSMLPTIDNKKDIVTLTSPKDFKKYDLLLLKYQNKYILHRLVKIKKDNYYFCGDHNVCLEGPINNIDIIAKVISYTHKGKTMKINRLFYIKGKILFLSRKIRSLLRRIFHAGDFKTS